jgi:hypothetical protein
MVTEFGRMAYRWPADTDFSLWELDVLDAHLLGVAALTPGAGLLGHLALRRDPRSRHCRVSTLSSISATFSQLPCFGVCTSSSSRARRNASAGPTA